MRTFLVFVLAGVGVVGCGADEGPSKCVEGATADCSCGGFLTGQQFCSGGVFSACSCGSSGTGGSAGFAGTGGLGGTGVSGTGGSAGFAGTGGTAGFAGTGGTAGFSGTGGTGGTGVSGTGGTGVSGTGGTGVSGTGGTGVSGTGGTGGESGSGGTGGSGGDSGTGGTGPGGAGEYLASCDTDLGNAECAAPLVCYRATAGGSGSTTGPGFCTHECSRTSDCPAASGASFTCGSEGKCRAICGGVSGDGCPAGMTCSGDFGFGGRCNY